MGSSRQRLRTRNPQRSILLYGQFPNSPWNTRSCSILPAQSVPEYTKLSISSQPVRDSNCLVLALFLQRNNSCYNEPRKRPQLHPNPEFDVPAILRATTTTAAARWLPTTATAVPATRVPKFAAATIPAVPPTSAIPAATAATIWWGLRCKWVGSPTSKPASFGQTTRYSRITPRWPTTSYIRLDTGFG